MASHSNNSPHPVLAATHIASVRSAAEKRLGILFYASPIDYGWHGDIRKRYTDFLVNEVRKDGSVIHLSDFQQSSRRPRVDDAPANNTAGAQSLDVRAPAAHPIKAEAGNTQAVAEATIISPINDADRDILTNMLGDTVVHELIDLDAKIQRKDNSSRGVLVSFPAIQDRQQRTLVHQEIRRIFSSRLETQAGDGGIINARAAPRNTSYRQNQNGPRQNQNGPRNRDNGWRGGQRAEPRAHRNQYLHFTLYKENKDTMDAINHIARLIKVKASNFGFAGTKDRRAATVQRVSVWNKDISDLVSLNDKMTGIRVGDFAFQKKPMQLGQHGGNQFVIAIKNVQLTRGGNFSIAHRLRMTEYCVQFALDNIVRTGFINYFGLQRFGTHAIGTQEIGMKILREDFTAAVDGILHVDPDLSLAIASGNSEARFHKDEFDRARAIAIWKMSGKAEAATRVLPKKYAAENSLIRHLGKAPNDHCGAILSITRGLRQLYCHAYQSYIWNYAASKRWSRYGDQVVVGDLVMVQPNESPIAQRSPAEDMSEDVNQEEEEFYQRARPLTKDEVASGRYTIFDVVLPAPGFDVIYPANDIGTFYSDFMARQENGGLNPYEMRRRQREFSLSGHYRKLMARFTATPMFAVRPYTEDEEQMHPTDRDLIEWRKFHKAAEIQSTANAWNNFANNADKFDAALLDEARRRRMQSPNMPSETRINDEWIETALDGGKRQKVQNPVKVETISHTQDHDMKENAPPPPIAEPDAISKNEDLAKIPSERADVPMANAELVQLSKNDDIKSMESKEANRPASAGLASPTTARPDLMGYLQAHLKKSAEDSENENAPMDRSQSPPDSKPAVATDGGSAPEQASKEIPSRATRATPPVNVFDDFEKFVHKDHPAVNVTGRVPLPVDGNGETVAASEDQKVAVILNFTLNSSNYATVCMREMMGQAAGN
ncbi:hypothetical protein RB594_007471 [Gaeumannomyces avenae]